MDVSVEGGKITLRSYETAGKPDAFGVKGALEIMLDITLGFSRRFWS